MASMSLLLTLIAFNNVTDYASNLPFVTHVLSMDTTFRHQSVMWRAVTHPAAHHAAYIVMIAWEILSAALLVSGTIRMAKAMRAQPGQFAEAQALAVIGLAASVALWLTAFLAIGGEWFLMWQSSEWNGQDAAFRMFAVSSFTLLVVIQPEPHRESDS
jgi:predicted small integral membrane protein